MASISVKQVVKAPCEQVYFMFTNAMGLREWLADGATVEAKPAGRFFLWWNDSDFTTGEYTGLDANREIDFTWRGANEPATQVSVSLSEAAAGTWVNVIHTDLDELRLEDQKIFESEWKRSLENLASVLETGVDLRLYRRPMLGIYVGNFDAQAAEQLGVPVSQGVRLSGVVEGLGAKKAGLQADDVIVRLKGAALDSFNSLVQALKGSQAGDEVEVFYYRGKEECCTLMTLSGRPIPEVSWEPAVMAGKVRQQYEAAYKDLQDILAGLSEADASRQPGAGEWSPKETLAHLIHSERGLNQASVEMLFDQERVSDGFGDNLPAQVAATVSTYGSLAALLEELQRNQAENVALLANLPSQLAGRKSTYFRLVTQLTGNFDHFKIHLDQIRQAISAPRP